MQDQIILLGDLFDRGGADPDPIGVYYRISGLNTNVTWSRGNHDQLLTIVHLFFCNKKYCAMASMRISKIMEILFF